jgi:invasion protein IalB
LAKNVHYLIEIAFRPAPSFALNWRAFDQRGSGLHRISAFRLRRLSLMSMSSFIVLCLLCVIPQAALAQKKSPPQKPAPAAAPKPSAVSPDPEPQITTTNFGDWALRCQRIVENLPPNCEVSLTIQQKDQPAPIAKIALGRPIASQGVHLLVLLPNNVSFPSTVQIKSDDKDIWGIDIPWQRCIPGACFAETALKDSDLVRWRALDGAGKITFKDASSNEVGISFSFHGLTQALDALAQQSQ